MLTTNLQPVTLRYRKGTPECDAVVSAWNQGIDSRLQAITGSKYTDCGGMADFLIAPTDLPVLVRRLRETRRKVARAVADTIQTRAALPVVTPFLRAYVAAMLFCESHGESDQSFEEGGYGPEHLAPATLATMAADCVAFQAKHAADYAPGANRGSGQYTGEEQAGHDFWMTRTGSGVGFWDGDWAEPGASRMDSTCKEMGSQEVYLGDDGLIYLSR